MMLGISESTRPKERISLITGFVCASQFANPPKPSFFLQNSKTPFEF